MRAWAGLLVVVVVVALVAPAPGQIVNKPCANNLHMLCMDALQCNNTQHIGCYCAPGFTMASACTQCTDDSFGPNCTACMCLHGGTCDWGRHASGACTCKGNYAGVNCEKCKDGLYGPLCKTKCPDCHRGTCRNSVDRGGTCDCWLIGLDAASNCTQCRSNYYGTNCTECGSCNNGVCRSGISGDGSCVCEQGWASDNCDQPVFVLANLGVWIGVAAITLITCVTAFSNAQTARHLVPHTDWFGSVPRMWALVCTAALLRFVGVVFCLVTYAQTKPEHSQQALKRLVVFNDAPNAFIAAAVAMFLLRVAQLATNEQQAELWPQDVPDTIHASRPASQQSLPECFESPLVPLVDEPPSQAEALSSPLLEHPAPPTSVLGRCFVSVASRLRALHARRRTHSLAARAVWAALVLMGTVSGVSLVVLVCVASQLTSGTLRPWQTGLDVGWCVMFALLLALAATCRAGLERLQDSQLPSAFISRGLLLRCLRQLIVVLCLVVSVLVVALVFPALAEYRDLNSMRISDVVFGSLRVLILFTLLPSPLFVLFRPVRMLQNRMPHGDSFSCLVDFRLLKLEPRPVAAGTSGRVFFGLYAGTEVAIKEQRITDLMALQQAITEAAFLTRVTHPHVVRFIALSLKKPYCYTITEKCDFSLQRVINAHRQLQEESMKHVDPKLLAMASGFRWQDVALQISLGMAYLHRVGLIHRDLKPANVLVSNGIVKICDFGTAKMGGGRHNTARLGTPAYMAPELFVGQKTTEYSGAVDVYSFGIIVWVLVTRQQPFADVEVSSNFELLQRVKGGLRPTRLDSITDGEWALMSSCWADDPSTRPTFAELTDRLQSDLARPAV